MAISVLVDQYGNPIELDELEEELAAPKLASVRSVWHESVATYLTPARLSHIIRQVDEGDALEYLTLAEEMEERDMHYHSVLSTRKLAVGGLDLLVESPTDDADDVYIADAVRELLEQEEAHCLIADLTDAIGKGYSVCETMWDREGEEWYPKNYIWRDPRFFRYDWQTRSELRLLSMASPSFGERLKPFKFVHHQPRIKTGIPLRGGLARLACVSFMCKGYALRDWLSFAEIYGMPIRIGKYGKGATKEERRRLLSAVSQIGTDAAGIIPEDMMIEFIATTGGGTSGGDKLFSGLAEFLDKQVSKGVLGQTASTEGTPGRLGADDAQENVRGDILSYDGRQMAATLSRDVVKPFVDLNFGPRERGKYPKVKLEKAEVEDLAKLSTALPPFIQLGMRVEASEIRDKFGLAEPEEGAEVLQAPGMEGPPGEEEMGPEEFGGGDDPGEYDESEVYDEVEPEDADPETDEWLDEDEAPPPPKAALNRLMRKAQLALARKKLTEDTIDKEEDQTTKQWQRVIEPVLQPIIDLAQSAKTEKEFIKGLEKLELSTDPFVRALAMSTFKARGMGLADG